jgi:flagellar hook-associated protein 2
MAGIQVSGLVSGINWQSIVSELVQADSAGINAVKAQQTTVNTQVSALGSLGTDLTNLSNAVITLEDPTTYGGVVAGSTTTNSTWVTAASNGTALGSTVVAVTGLASAAQLQGAGGISSKLSATSSVSGLTLANLAVAQPVTAGTITVDGQQVTLTGTESLADAFTAIATATGGNVTGAYDPTTDKVTLTDGTGQPVVLGAANDTSNFFTALKLSNNGTRAVTSGGTLGSVQLGQPLASSALKTALTGLDGSGNGSLVINGVTINYNATTDTLSTLIGRINNSGAGVTAAYDSTNDRMVLTNNVTGDSGFGASDASGNLLAALGLASSASPTLVRGTNAVFTVNGGPTQTSASNTLSAAALGVPGLSVTVDSKDTQTIEVQADTTALSTAIQGFITNFNTLQTDIGTDTQITTNNGTTSTSVLSGLFDVSNWASSLQSAAFSAGDGLTGSFTGLDSLGIDFNGTTGQLTIADQGKLTSALAQNPTGVQAFFQTAHTGFGSLMNAAIADVTGQQTSEKSNLSAQSTDLGTHITAMQTQLDAEQAQLDAEFEAMETALSSLQNQSSALTSMFSGTSATTSSSNLSTALNSAVSSGTSNSSSSSSSSSTSGTSGTSTS